VLAAGRWLWPLALAAGSLGAATSVLDARSRIEPAWNTRPTRNLSGCSDQDGQPESRALARVTSGPICAPLHLPSTSLRCLLSAAACCLHANGALQHPPSVIQSRLPKLDPDPEHVVPCPHAPTGVGKKGRAILLQHHNLLSAAVCLRPDVLGRLGRGRHWPRAVQEWLDWCAFPTPSRHVCNTDTALQATSHLPSASFSTACSTGATPPPSSPTPGRRSTTKMATAIWPRRRRASASSTPPSPSRRLTAACASATSARHTSRTARITAPPASAVC
jgi:hypothetical protein